VPELWEEPQPARSEAITAGISAAVRRRALCVDSSDTPTSDPTGWGGGLAPLA